MGIIRITKQKNFSIISNIPLYDNRLSFKSKGLWAYLMSKPDDWTVYMSQLTKASKDGKDSVRSGIHELMDYGYIERHQVRNSDGQFVGYEYIVNENSNIVDEPSTENPKAENPTSVNPISENPPLLKTDRIPNTDLKKNDVPAPKQTPPSKPLTNSTSSSQSPCLKQKKPAQLPAQDTETTTEQAMETILSALVLMVPKDLQKPSVIAKLSQAIKNGLSLELIKSCIEYSNDRSDKATWQRYRSHLGQCIDGQWGAGYSTGDSAEDAEARDKAALQGRRGLPNQVLKVQADQGDIYAKQVLSERVCVS